MSFESVLRGTGIRVPDTGCVVATAGSKATGRNRRELGCENGLAVAGNAMSEARDCLYPENSLGLGAECDGGSTRRGQQKMFAGFFFPAGLSYSKGFSTPCCLRRPRRSDGYWSTIMSLPGI